MIQPTSITNFARTDRELQVFWLFCIMVAGKNSDQTAQKVGQLVNRIPAGTLPFDHFRENPHAIHNLLVANRIGQYGRIEQAIRESVDLNLRTDSVARLMGVFGVGPKTARFFVLHSRAQANCAVLDTHVLKWLTQRGVENVPSATPQKAAEYQRLEQLFLALSTVAFPGLSVAEADLFIWTQMSGRLDNDDRDPVLPGEPAAN